MRGFFTGLLAAALSMASLALPLAAAPQMNKDLYDLGSGICAQIANEQLALPGTKQFIEQVDAHGWERSEFCHCVGEEFGLSKPQFARMDAAEGDDASVAILEIIRTNMTICQPGLPAYSDLMSEKDDVWQCRQVMDGSLKLPGFNLKDALARARAGDLSTDSLCGCTAGFISLMSEGLAKPVGMAEPGASYKMQLGTGIELCLQQLGA